MAAKELSVLQTPLDRPARHDDDFICNGNPTHEQGKGDIDPEILMLFPGSDRPSTNPSKRKSADKKRKGKRAKYNYATVQDVTRAMNNMFATVRFTHVTDPNETIYKAIDGMQEYPLLVCLDLHSCTHVLVI